MNKKFRFVGAAAAALLAVAPVATAAVVPAATVFAAAGDTTNEAIKITVAGPAAREVATTDSVANYKTSASFPVTTTVGNIAGVSSVSVKDLTGKDATAFGMGSLYNQSATVSISGLDSSKYYSINGAAAAKPNSEGVVTGIEVKSLLTAYKKDFPGTPYFVYNNAVVGSTVPVTTAPSVTPDENGQTTVSAVEAAAKSVSGLAAYDGSSSTAATFTVKSIEGATVDANGKFTVPANGFSAVLSVTNGKNGKAATVVLPFAGYTNTTKNPKFSPVKDSYTVANGASFDPLNPDASGKINAHLSSTDPTLLDIAVVSNPVNTKVAGTYTVTLKATNPAGLSSTTSYKVVVGSADTSVKTIHYVSGYGVNVWSVYDNGSVAFTGSRILDGTSVKTYGTKVVAGVSYTRVNSATSNTWVQSKYFEESTPAPTPTPTPSDEVAVSGVVKVTYKGAGKVRLVNASGKYVAQYVSKNSSWKVFGKKTINGNVYYRIGSQSQWIPAQYVSFK